MLQFPQLMLIAALLVTSASCSSSDPKTPNATSSGGASTTPTSSTPEGANDANPTNTSDSHASDIQKANEAGVLVRSYPSDPNILNLIIANDSVSTAFQRWVYETLAAQDIRDPDNWIPTLAESWEFDPETLEYTFHLRKGVKWHPITLPNGKVLEDVEFTSRDVKFTFDCILNEHVEAASLRSYYTKPDAETDAEKVKIQVTPVDKYTVKIKWSEPYFMANEFTLGAPVMPRHVYSVDADGEPISFDFSSKEFADGFNIHWANSTMCGTGPLIFDAWEKDKHVKLSRNPNYWGKPFSFDGMLFKNIKNPNTELQELLQNQLDFAGIREKDQYIQTKSHANVKNGKVKLVEYSTTSYRFVGWNLKRELFKDPKVRLALSYAIPVDDIIENIYFGLATRTTGPFLPGSTAYDDSLEPIPFDLKKSRELLDEAGWKVNTDSGLREKVVNGKPVVARFKLLIYADSPQYLSISEIIKEQFRKIGVEVTIDPAKWNSMLDRLNSKEFDATILGWATSWRGDPQQLWHSSQADLQDSSNSIGYKSPEVDKLIDKLHVTIDPDEQAVIYKQIHKLIYEDQPYTFLYSDKATGGLHQRIGNVEFFPKQRPHYDVREWTASPAGR